MAAAPDFSYSFADVDLRACELSLRYYVEMAWRTVEPRKFVGNWHIDAICEHLEAISKGQLQNLIINIPPRHSKSLLVSVFWPSWEWGPNNHPDLRWMCASYASPLSIRDSVRCRRVIQSSWYQSLWGDRFQLMGDQNAKMRYDTDRGGFRLATSVDGLATGEGGDRRVIDDPNNIRDVESETKREVTNTWWDHSMATREDDMQTAATVIIQQRAHQDDLTGHILEVTPDEYKCLILPAEYEKGDRRTTTGFVDPRKEEGELLNPERFPRKAVDTLKKRLGPYAAAGQLQQRPAPKGGGVLESAWWKYYTEAPKDFDFVLQTWDMAFKGKITSAYVCGQVIGAKGSQRWLLDQRRDKLSFVQTIDAVVSLSERWPEATYVFVEDAANGPAVMDSLREKIGGLIPISPEGSKESRASAISPWVRAGDVFLPLESLCPWVKEFVAEWAFFPAGRYKDQVDAFAQGLIQARKIELKLKRLQLPKIESFERPSVLAGLR